MQEHSFSAGIRWTGNTGAGTLGHTSYARRYDIVASGKPVIPGSSDPAFRGDGSRYNPEDLLVASISACHMLWYLGLCAMSGVVVTSYEDDAEGTMVVERGGGGRFIAVVLRPRIRFAPGADLENAQALHHDANAKCFIANSLNFQVSHEPIHEVEQPEELRTG